MKFERELNLYKKNSEEEGERLKGSLERKIKALEKEIDEWKKRTQKTETNESGLVVDNRRLTAELVCIFLFFISFCFSIYFIKIFVLYK